MSKELSWANENTVQATDGTSAVRRSTGLPIGLRRVATHPLGNGSSFGATDAGNPPKHTDAAQPHGCLRVRLTA